MNVGYGLATEVGGALTDCLLTGEWSAVSADMQFEWDHSQGSTDRPCHDKRPARALTLCESRSFPHDRQRTETVTAIMALLA